jgi:hypothetical protein
MNSVGPAIVPDREDWFEVVHGFPQPEWQMVSGWMRVFVPLESLHDAWQQFVRHWLRRICTSLGGTYSIEESQHFHFLSNADAKERTSFLAFLEHARNHIRRVLSDIGTPEGPGKHVVLRFADLDDYDRYYSHYALDGEQASSGGVFLNVGYLHIAFPASDRPDVHRRTCAHELSHNLLAHLPLPPWLNEAIAMGFETDLAGTDYTLTRELAALHRGYWNAESIQSFWQGSAFFEIDAQELAYSLARTLLDLIHQEVGPSPENFRRFVLRADLGDAGAVAAREHLDVELAELAECFLGPGEWAPRPQTWAALTAFSSKDPTEGEDIEFEQYPP